MSPSCASMRRRPRRSSVRRAAAEGAAADRLPEEDRMAAPCIARNWDENVSLDELERAACSNTREGKRGMGAVHTPISSSAWT